MSGILMIKLQYFGSYCFFEHNNTGVVSVRFHIHPATQKQFVQKKSLHKRFVFIYNIIRVDTETPSDIINWCILF